MKNIVYIGGGNGVMNIAPALRDDFNVTAIMSAFDDGGSYGRIRSVYKSPLTGDIRRALSALSTNDWGGVTEHRFGKGDIEGHAFGNLLLTAVFEKYNHPEKAMEILQRLFAVKGKVLGVSYDLAQLHAELNDRTILRGESVIDQPHSKSHIRIRRVWLDPDPAPAVGVLEAIKRADLIIFGPGDIYTSAIPPLLVPGVADSVVNSTAKKVYFCNAFTKIGQTNDFTALDHVKAIEQYLKVNSFATVIVCTSTIPAKVIDFHKRCNEYPVKLNIEQLESSGYDVVEADLLDGRIYEKSAADQLNRSKIKFAFRPVKAVIERLLNNEIN